MICGFNFSTDTAIEQCKEWLSNECDLDLEHLETQRASIENIIRLDTTLSEDDKVTLTQVERMLYDHLVSNGAISAPVLRDDALGGDLLDLGYNRAPL